LSKDLGEWEESTQGRVESEQSESNTGRESRAYSYHREREQKVR
jgi:hypothetical protein